MAQYQHLPIYKQTDDILLRTMAATKDFPREYKYTVVQILLDAGADIHALSDRQVRRLALAYERDAIAKALTSPGPKEASAFPSLSRR